MLCCMLSVEKISRSNDDSNVTSGSNLIRSLSKPQFFLEILQFLSIVRDNFCETFSIFYLSLYVSYHATMASLMFFWLRLLFLELQTNKLNVAGRVLPPRCFKFLFISLVWPKNRLNNMNMIFLPIFVHYFMYLQIKFDLYPLKA